jgi:hypothetical protein
MRRGTQEFAQRMFHAQWEISTVRTPEEQNSGVHLAGRDAHGQFAGMQRVYGGVPAVSNNKSVGRATFAANRRFVATRDICLTKLGSRTL